MNAHSDGEAPCLLLLEKVARKPDVEGTPIDNCLGAVLW